jgi:choline dehydrogenase-like flavoprotein
MIEEGGYYRTDDFTTDATDMIHKLYRNSGSTMAIGKPNVNFMEGRCVGGSTVINAGISWRTPNKILKQWEWEHGVEGVDPDELEPVFEKVEERVHVAPQDEITYGGDAWVFKEGARKLGYSWLPVHRNQKHCVGTNNCIFGCPTGAKQSVLVTYVPRALQAGATLLTNCRATKVKHKNGRASAVLAEFIDSEDKAKCKVEVRAKHVVLSAGAVQTPGILKRSKVPDPHKQIGSHLTLHPNSKVVGLFDRELEAWKGAIQGVQITEFMEEGLMFGTTFVPPSVHVLTLPYWGAEAKAMMSHLNQMVTGAVLVEDTDSIGKIRLGFGGEPVMTYELGDQDYQRLRRGVALLSEIYFAAGATEVELPFHALQSISSKHEIPRIFDDHLKKKDIEVLTVHAMGTARMGSDPERSATDSWGRVHGMENLHVADASLFPSPIGVNPQITVMMLGTRNAQHLLKELAVTERATA